MKQVYYYGNKDLQGLRWVARVVEFGVGLEIASAFNEMYCAVALLREDKLYSKEVKRECNKALEQAAIREEWIKKNMANKQFWLDYSDYIIDLASQDITMFRIAIKQALDDGKHKKSTLLSYVETARVLLEMSTQQFDLVMEDALTRYGRDYRKDFAEYRVTNVLFSWTRMCNYLYKGSDVNLNTERTSKAFEALCSKFGAGAYIEPCIAKARESNPDFANQVKVME